MTKLFKIYQVKYTEIDGESIDILVFRQVVDTLEEAESIVENLVRSTYKQYTILPSYSL